jgi:hypothetical protein
VSVKYSKGPSNISTFYDLRPSKIYPTWEFWFENKPSGNPGSVSLTQALSDLERSGSSTPRARSWTGNVGVQKLEAYDFENVFAEKGDFDSQ